MRGIDDHFLRHGIDHEIHRFERQHAHQRLVAEHQRFRGIGAVAEGDFDGPNFRDFDLAAIGEGDELGAELLRFEAKLARLFSRDSHV